MGLLYQPYSSKSYDIVRTDLQANGDSYFNHFKGDGTLNTAQAAISYRVTNEFAVGVRANLYFGSLSDINEFTTSNSELINGYETKNKIKNLNFTVGTSYQKLNTSTDRKFTLGATATFGNTSEMTTNYTNSTYYYTVATGDVKNNLSIIDTKNKSSKNLLPLQASLGAGYGSENQWFVSAQLDYKKGETVTYFGNPFEFQDSYRISAGGWYLPNYNNFRSYFSRVVYRYGAFFEKGSLQIAGNNINKMGISAGVMLPFKSSNISRMSGLELGVEVGKRGTTKDNLINQNFVNLRVGFNFADKWFRKSLYN